MKQTFFSFLLLLAFCFLSSCTSEVRADSKRSVLIDGVPHVRQKPDFCGEACAEMYLKKLGESIDQDYVFDRSGLDPALGRGCYTAELAESLKRIGFIVGPVWHPLSSTDTADREFMALYSDLQKGIPSIVCMHYSDSPNTTEHFRLVLGYDAVSDEIIYHEPAEDDGAYRRMQRETFLELWPLRGKNHRTAIRLRLEPGDLEYGSASVERTAADYAQHIMKLKEKVPRGFTIVVEPPFVVIGDESAAMVRKRAASTVRFSVAALRNDYFSTDPQELIDIWLFKDNASYRRHAKALFGHSPDTPYGYYSETHNALVMNISTGGGTLVHEIVHPFVRANFPDCPAWFNEGLGSLYEGCTNRDGHLFGLPNWRLPRLQEAIRAGNVPSFEQLTSTSETEFYEHDPGTNYAQARYLLYYLQEKGLLKKYYHQFLRDRASDPTGYETLQIVLGQTDMASFQSKWQQWVLRIRL